MVETTYVYDASDKVLGRLASHVANQLLSTAKAGDGARVIIVNAEKIKVTGNKETDKVYFKHTGYPGGGSEISLAEMRRSKPHRILENAVKGMLPHNRLGRSIFSHLKVYSGPDHPHSAQKPKTLEI